MIQAIIFDFDGLILDTELPDYQSWQEVFGEHGCRLELERWCAFIGSGADMPFNPYDELEAQLGRPIDRAAIRARRRRRYAELVAAEAVLPGVEAIIAGAGRLGLRLAVASSSSRAWVAGHLARLGLLDRFACLRCADDVARTKPDPALYLAALDDLGLAPAEAIALEDSPNGVLAAKRAGLFCVAVPNVLTVGLPLDHADLRLASLADLPLEHLLWLVEERPGSSAAQQQ